MRNFVPANKRTMIVRLAGIIFAGIFSALFIAPTAFTQKRVQIHDVDPTGMLSSSSYTPDAKTEIADYATADSSSSSALAPDLVTGTTYPFTSTTGITLEDMSSGTTQLVA